VLSAGYLAHLSLSGLPGPAAIAVRQSVFGGVAVAQQLHSGALLASVRAGFVDGLDKALMVSAGFALLGAVLSLLFLPKSSSSIGSEQPGTEEKGQTVGAR